MFVISILAIVRCSHTDVEYVTLVLSEGFVDVVCHRGAKNPLNNHYDVIVYSDPVDEAEVRRIVCDKKYCERLGPMRKRAFLQVFHSVFASSRSSAAQKLACILAQNTATVEAIRRGLGPSAVPMHDVNLATEKATISGKGRVARRAQDV